MMTLRRSLFTAGLCLVLLPVVAAAQVDRPWYVVIYDRATGRLVRVDGRSGAATDVHLNVDQPADLNGQQITISPDAFRAAYCIVHQTPGDPEGEATLYVHDLELDQVDLVLALGPALRCNVNRHAYNEIGSRLAVSLMRSPAVDDAPLWRILVIDPDGRTRATLTADDAAVNAAGLAPDDSLDPQVREFRMNHLTFAAVPYGVGGTPAVAAYRWILTDGSVAPVKGWGAFSFDALDATGELLYVDHDPTRPAGDPGGAITPFNRVMLMENAASVRMIYHCPDWTILSAQFINNGLAMALEFLEPARLAGERGQRTRWITLTRAAAAEDLGVFAAEAGAQLAAAPPGWIMLWAEANAGDDYSRAVARIDYPAGDEVRTLWKEALPAKAEMTWDLVWVSPSIIVAGPPPFFVYTPPG
ncbi:MAG: hypothetical protein KC547_15705, partial [Anaerolineae bacterium]|nr:hypothetical protein [Anaerolineae bacterium]